MVRMLCIAHAALLFAAATAIAEASSKVVDIGSRRELFVDTYLLDRMEGLDLKLHEPVRAEAEAEAMRGLEYATIIVDGALYRLYTRDSAASTGDGTPGEVTRYYESDDGIRWRAPNLGVVTFNESADNNIVLAEPPFSHNFSPFLDSRPAVPESERFKALAGLHEKGMDQPGLVAFASGDGIRWRKIRDEPVISIDMPWPTRKLFDSQNVVFWSEHEGRYVCYFRSHAYGQRRIGRIVSNDFVTWTDAKLLDVNIDGEHLYTSQTHPYFRAPHIYVALPTRYFPDRGNSTDILFMSAREDGLYDRPFKQAFIRPGLDPARWGNRANYAALNVIPTGEAEISIYATPFRRFTLRTDGFASLHAGAEIGLAVTRPVTFSGRRLAVNCATSAGGSLRVEVQTADGTPIEPFKLERSVPFVGDRIEHTLEWEEGKDLSALAGKPVRLRFELREADLYSFAFQD